MSERVTKILKRLGELDFITREGEFTPFEESLPLVSGVAWDIGTAQLVLIAEMDEDTEDAEWRQLLFASAGLRHHLVADGPAAFGPPVIVAIVGDSGRRRLRDLAEDLAERYVLFNRVDLNLVHEDDLDNPERLDDALAPLLPRCRTGLGQEISRADVERFWTMLRAEITTTGRGLNPVFGERPASAAQELAERLIAGDDHAHELPAPTPLKEIRIREFRSIREAEAPLASVTIVHGPNGGGKSSLLEAMELVWAGTSLRKPPGVDAQEYARHLPRNGGGGFSVSADGQEVNTVVETARAELARSVLTQDSMAALVSQSPEERYQALLATTGLEMPDLAARAQRLCDETRRAADAALSAAGLPTLRRRDSDAVKHLRTGLAGEFSKRLPDTHELVGAEESLIGASAGAYAPSGWPNEDHARAALIRADTLIGQLLNDEERDSKVVEALNEAREQVAALTTARRDALQPLRRLLDLIRQPPSTPIVQDRSEPKPAPLPQELAVRWLAHASGLRDAASRFRSDAEVLSDDGWAERLRAYAERLAEAAAGVPAAELEKLARHAPHLTARTGAPVVSKDIYLAAGFGEPAAEPEAILGATAHLIAVLEAQVQALDRLADNLATHPARSFAEHADAVLEALCRFELARKMRNAGPILNASERLVAELLQTRLAPVVRELVASIVRFEWYFEPLLVPEKGRKVVLGGLATPQPDLDARLLLNAAERTALGIAWFLALNLLQPPERRQLLVLDDPTSGFDAPNQAGLISTLRAFVRLTRPAQLVVSTHDDLVAALLVDEMVPVDGWPAGARRVRCQRDSYDCTVIVAGPERQEPLSVEAEIESLGLGKATLAS
jgi:energy-coupling factor transporter ATP-binding protein EcfA2